MSQPLKNLPKPSPDVHHGMVLNRAQIIMGYQSSMTELDRQRLAIRLSLYKEEATAVVDGLPANQHTEAYDSMQREMQILTRTIRLIKADHARWLEANPAPVDNGEDASPAQGVLPVDDGRDADETPSEIDPDQLSPDLHFADQR